MCIYIYYTTISIYFLLLGFVPYTIVKPQFVKPGQFKYAVREVRDDEGDCMFHMVLIDGASGKSDPLANIRNCEMLIKDGAVIGVNIDGDCIVRKDNDV